MRLRVGYLVSRYPPHPSAQMRIIGANRAALALLLALLATSAALRMPVTPLRTPQLRALPSQRAGTIQLVDEPSPEAEAAEPAAASPATGDDEPETVVVEFGVGFGDKSSPIWQKPKYADSSNLDKETPAALKLVLDYLCKWLMLELWVGGTVGRGGACSSADLTLALCHARVTFRPLCGSECCWRGLKYSTQELLDASVLGLSRLIRLYSKHWAWFLDGCASIHFPFQFSPIFVRLSW